MLFTDFPGPFNPERIRRLLQSQFQLVEDTESPDYIIFSVFGQDFLQYPEAIRIFFTGENVHPDFNLCDYALGYDWLEFGDRYYRCPNYQLYSDFKDMMHKRRTNAAESGAIYRRQGFCNYIYSNLDPHPFRERLFRAIGSYQRVDSHGKHLNNIETSLGPAFLGDWTGDKLRIQANYRFSIVCENSSTPGYTTEKIVHALVSDTIPIYFGNPLIGKEFNENRIINVHSYASLDAVVERVKAVNESEELFQTVLRQPFFPDDQPPQALTDEALIMYFNSILSKDKTSAWRRNPYVWGKRYEQRKRRQKAAEIFGDKMRALLAQSRGINDPDIQAAWRDWERAQDPAGD